MQSIHAVQKSEGNAIVFSNANITCCMVNSELWFHPCSQDECQVLLGTFRGAEFDCVISALVVQFSFDRAVHFHTLFAYHTLHNYQESYGVMNRQHILYQDRSVHNINISRQSIHYTRISAHDNDLKIAA